jgi:structural maintenance of chromosome 3 (chondroitin sulfate proteoglycan 6)
VVNRKGGFEGGYHDDRVSRCAAVSRIRAATSKLTDLAQRERGLNAELEALDTSINTLLNDLKKAELERDNLRAQSSQFSKDISNLRGDVKVAEDNLERRMKSLETLNAALNTSNSQIDLFRRELGSKLTSQLTAKERDELNEAETVERELSAKISQYEDELMQLSSERERLRAHLKSNLQKRYYEIMMQLEVAATGQAADPTSSSSSSSTSSSSKRGKKSPAAGAESAQDLTALRLEHARLGSLVASLESEVAELEKTLSGLAKDIGALEAAVEKHRADERAAESEMAEASKEQDRMLNKRSLVMDTVNEKQKLLRGLGSVPRKEVEEFKDLDETKLLKRLKDVNERLKKYASVNRKALDQYVSFNEQRESLIQRRDEIERENGAIQMLIESLDRQKDETILNTFRTVSKHFTAVFDELVPGGHGELIMRTDDEEGSRGDIVGSNIPGEVDAEEGGQRGSSKAPGGKGAAGGKSKAPRAVRLSVSTFQGVMVRVSFSGSGQQYSMDQLSGGQKALVALSLIFAIQR